MFAVTQFRPYICGRKFHLYTDHRPLIWLHNTKDEYSKLMGWKILINEFDYEVHFKPGCKNSNVDALSHNVSKPNIKVSDLKDDSDYEYDSSLCRGAQKVLVCADNPTISNFEWSEIFLNTPDDFENEEMIESTFVTHHDFVDAILEQDFNLGHENTNVNNSDDSNSKVSNDSSDDEYMTAEKDDAFFPPLDEYVGVRERLSPEVNTWIKGAPEKAMEKKEGRVVGSDSLPNGNCKMGDLLPAKKALSSTDRVASWTSGKSTALKKKNENI